jgi:hypothetical protein
VSKILTPRLTRIDNASSSFACDSGCKFISGSSITIKSPLLARYLKYKSNGASCLIEDEALYISISKPFLTKTFISFPLKRLLLNNASFLSFGF